MLRVDQVSKHFTSGKKGQITKAVDEISLTLQPNEIFALIGESGSGKSTLAELIAGLQQPTSGTITWTEEWRESKKDKKDNEDSKDNKDNKDDKDKRDKPSSRIQLVFQNPDRSMNPYWRVKDIIAEPLRLSKYPKQKAYSLAEELLAKVKLNADFMDRYPSECSGGQKQRIAIARALSMSPTLLVADEITSALDPTIEDELLQLLLSLKQSEGMSILYITHRLDTISGFADRVAVMKDGVIQEMGETETILAEPKSEYTRALLRAVWFG
ncbi:ATP-binding cassette domain-containing protein [Paenibacillus sp. LMG 31461]|uniref:ATP-binding cassette domain-containing protein n=1 Tax=Paenibacillus plantarum TaxID=2654975 RepID=A0ABX1XHK9_9BACL|nr:ATP-binding cassette domain-containing protein [Paenibacillus plantarum]NOU67904.1 ATP-binding cassette domain-containing protein [Paenibacillus plantarum]